MINDINLRKDIKAARNRTEAYHQLQRAIRKVYNGTFKGKRIVDNRISVSSADYNYRTHCLIKNRTF